MKRVEQFNNNTKKNNFYGAGRAIPIFSGELRSRRTYPPASQGKLCAAALRGTCFYPWRSPTFSKKHTYRQPSLRKAKDRRQKAEGGR